MKIYVTEIPTEPKKCLFARKEWDKTVLDIDTGQPTVIYHYVCNVNQKLCNVYCGGKCDKLIVFKPERDKV